LKPWYEAHKFPISLPGEPLDPLSPKFDELFIRLLPVYDELDTYLENINSQHGKFWISSPYGGTGKSTMLSYAAKYLYQHLPTLRALPIRLKVTKGEDEKPETPSVQHQFVKSLLTEFLKIGSELRTAADIFNITYPDDIMTELIWLEKHESNLQKLGEDLVEMSAEKLEAKFNQILEKAILPLRKRNIFSKYVLLVDEMDKITVEKRILSFLSGNQGFFEQLYNKYGFIAFFAGHESWVRRIRIGDEYNFYLGKVFDVPLFASIENVRSLIEANMLLHFGIQPSETTFTEEGYKKLQELTKGIPRRILFLATQVMNTGAQKKQDELGPGFIEEVLVTEEHSERAMQYLTKNPETYAKLRRAIEKKVDKTLYLFYSARNQIPKELDNELSLRTRTLGIEWSDEEWKNNVLTLNVIGCLEDKGSYRELSEDVIALFDELKDHQSVMDRVLATVIKKMGKQKLEYEKIPKPNFIKAVDEIFEISREQWFTKDDILDRFSDRSSVLAYAQSKHRDSSSEYIIREFEKAFSQYIEENEKKPKLIVVTENSETFYKILPLDLEEADNILLKLNSKELIDLYLNRVHEIKKCDKDTIADIDSLLERIIDLLAPQQSEFEKGILRTRKRHKLLKELGFSKKLKNRINYYLSETKDTCPSIGIVKETVSDICRSLFEKYIFRQKTNLPTEIMMIEDQPFKNLQKLYEVIGNLEGDIRVIDKDFDTAGFMFFMKLNPAKTRKLRVLGSKNRSGPTLREEFKAFRNELQKRGIQVEFRILCDGDAAVLHDRYLITDEIVYSTPPWNIIHKKYGDVRSLDSAFEKRKRFELYWGKGTNLVKEK
jgi:hypothetical protein